MTHAIVRSTREQWVGRVVIVHLAGSKCRRQRATSTDPLGVSCGRCQRRRVVRAALLSLFG